MKTLTEVYYNYVNSKFKSKVSKQLATYSCKCLKCLNKRGAGGSSFVRH